MGEYSSEMLFEVSNDDFAWFEVVININKGETESLVGKFWQKSEKAYGKKIEAKKIGGIRKRKIDQYGGWALLTDGKTIYFWYYEV